MQEPSGSAPPDDDTEAFRRAVADVRPLPPRPLADPAPRPRVRSRVARADRGAELRERVVDAAEPAAHVIGEHVSFRRTGVREDALRRLSRGQYRIEAEIDLHGLRRLAAHDALRRFLGECVSRHLRCVRVIHGKGLRSGPGGPVLRNVVDQWLRGIDDVLAFASARPVDGGTGALYVLLRK